MDLSIIIVNWNTKDFLIQCLESVYQLVEEKEIEVFVVDNASTDGSAAAVRERFPKVNLIENTTNLGFARANNQALSVANGRYLLLLNPDTLVKDEAIEKMLSFMEAHPEAGIAGVQLLNADGSKQNSIANFPSLVTELINKRLLRWLFPRKFPGKERDFGGPVQVDSIIGACMMVRREAMNQVGLLDERYFLFLEETDWCYRMKTKGWKIYHLPEAEVFHLQGKSAEQDKKRSKVEYYRSRYYFFRKNGGRFQWFILLTGLMIRLYVEILFTALMCTSTFFSIKKWRRRLSMYVYLAWWHLRFCPREMGLKPTNNLGLSPFTKGG